MCAIINITIDKTRNGYYSPDGHLNRNNCIFIPTLNLSVDDSIAPLNELFLRAFSRCLIKYNIVIRERIIIIRVAYRLARLRRVRDNTTVNNIMLGLSSDCRHTSVTLL